MHTPGPWKWFNYPDGRMLLTAPSEAVIHCPGAPMGCTAEDQALIAAAPDLLAALKEAEEFVHGWMEQNTGARELAALERIEAAIAKAEGR